MAKAKNITLPQLVDFAEKADERLDKLEAAIKPTFDPEPIEGSTNSITSGAVYKALGDVGAVLDSINGEVV